MTTLSQLKTRARQLADMENSNFIGDSELTYMINASYQELYDLVLESFEDYFISSTSFTLTSGDAGVYALPATFYKMKGLDVLQGSDYVDVHPFQWSSRNRQNRAFRNVYMPYADVGYRLVGSNLRLEPNDAAAGTYRLWYVPSLTTLSSDSDAIDSSIISRSGWEQYIVIDVARMMRLKEESATSDLEQMKASIVSRIRSGAADRDIGQGEVIRDVQGQDDWRYRGRW